MCNVYVSPRIGDVHVSYVPDAHNTCGQLGAGYRVTFLTDLGALPLLVSSESDTIFVERIIPGTKQAVECAGRGICGMLQTLRAADNLAPYLLETFILCDRLHHGLVQMRFDMAFK